MTKDGSKTLAQMHAETIAANLFADMMSSAGVSVNRMAQELLYFIPKDFRDQYIALWMAGLKGDDCDANESGRRAQSVGDLGKKSGGNSKERTSTNVAGVESETRSVGGRGGRGKKYKRYWTIKDERAIELKDRIDKRLRGIGRDIESEMNGWEK